LYSVSDGNVNINLTNASVKWGQLCQLKIWNCAPGLCPELSAYSRVPGCWQTGLTSLIGYLSAYSRVLVCWQTDLTSLIGYLSAYSRASVCWQTDWPHSLGTYLHRKSLSIQVAKFPNIDERIMGNQNINVATE
jgi:hypothetical protein